MMKWSQWTLAHVVLLLVLISTGHAYHVRWLVAELRSFDLTPGCLMSELCRSPQLKTVLTVGHGSQVASSVELNATAQGGVYDRVVSNPLEPVRLRDIEVVSEIVGTDPAFNFARICDNSSKEQLLVPADETGNDKKVYHLKVRGNCFRAHIRVSVHQNSCPWCIFEAESIVAEDKDAEPVPSTALLVACVISTLISVGLFVACVWMCRVNRRLSRKMRRSESSSHCSPSTQNTSDSGYDIPWRHFQGATMRTAGRIVRGPSQNSQTGPYHRPTTIIPQHALVEDQNLLRLSPGDYPQKPGADRTFGLCLNTNHHGQAENTIHVTAVPYKENHDDSGRDSI